MNLRDEVNFRTLYCFISTKYYIFEICNIIRCFSQLCSVTLILRPDLSCNQINEDPMTTKVSPCVQQFQAHIVYIFIFEISSHFKSKHENSIIELQEFHLLYAFLSEILKYCLLLYTKTALHAIFIFSSNLGHSHLFWSKEVPIFYATSF